MTRWITRIAVAIPLLALVFSSGCADDAETTPDSGTNNNCAPGLKPMGPACVPIFDECKDDEVPMLGGGCKRVGVKECLDGWGLMGPPDWKCKPIGPPRTCWKGWEKVAGGWCEPILPKNPCPAGTMEKIGYSTCQPIGDCGSDTWGNIKTTASTIYVDQGHKGTGGKGTKAEPFKTIGEAVNKATAGDHIAVAAGKYVEQIIIHRKVTLEGRCSQLVTINGGKANPTLEFKNWANESLMRGVTITGNGTGLWITGVDILLDRVAVRGCAWRGIEMDSEGVLTIRDSLVAGNRDFGIIVFNSKVVMDRSVVRDTRGRTSDERFGVGIQVTTNAGFSNPSGITMRDSIVSENRYIGVLLSNAKATLERTIVRETHEQTVDNGFGFGIQATTYAGLFAQSEIILRDSVVVGNRAVGILLESSKATLERTVVRNTREQASDKSHGTGIQASVGYGQTSPSELTLRNSLVMGNRIGGILLESSNASLERTVVRDNLEQLSDKMFGTGIQASISRGQSRASVLTARDSLVAGNTSFGILLQSSTATLERIVVRDTREQVLGARGGTGIDAMIQEGQTLPSKLTIRDAFLSGNKLVGIYLHSSNAIIERSVIRETRWSGTHYSSGLGIVAEIQSKRSLPSVLIVRDSLIARNHICGVQVQSSKATLERTSVKDTIGHVMNGEDGIGVQAVIQPGYFRQPDLTVRESLVANNRSVGMSLLSSKVIMERTVVRDTREQSSDGRFGTGIEASIQPDQSLPTELTIRDSLIMRNHQVGIAFVLSRGKIMRSAVIDTLPNSNGEYGDGIAAGYGAVLVVEDATVDHNARVGVLFIDSGGSVHRSLIRGNVFAIDLEDGASPLIGDDNQIVDNQINHVTIGQGLKPPPVPSVPNIGGTDATMDSGLDAGVSSQ